MAQPFDQPNVGILQKLHEFLLSHGKTVATAESCTGGLLCARLTELSGSSGYVEGGVCSYSNRIKELELGVAPETLAREGAVSEAVARAMAEGLKRSWGVDYAISITGIAGPTGGTTAKPVGTVWFAVCGDRGTRAFRDLFSGDRGAIRVQAVERAVRLLAEEVGVI